VKIEIIEEKYPAQAEICQPMMQCPAKAISYRESKEALFGARMLVDEQKCDLCKICIDLCC
jgi:ferredoxin